MNEKFESQKERLIAIKQEISLLYQQVNYLIRNEKPLELLDLDVLMNRTHTLYDQLCAIHVGDESLAEEMPFDAEELMGLFGGMTDEASVPEAEDETHADDEAPVAEEAPMVEENTIVEPTPTEEEIPVEVVMPVEEAPEVIEPEPQPEPEPEPQLEPEPEPTGKEEEKPLGDEFGFFFRFEDIPAEEQAPEKPVESEGKVVHVMEPIPEEEIPERDRVHGDDLVQDNPLEMPEMEDERPMAPADEIGRHDSGSVSNFFEPDDADFELSTPEVLGEKMMGVDNSLAAKLQQNPIRDLKSVIGINDKFLFVNELFGGSMEKYNKSIENLNDLKTLNGALIYLNELKIELQWNSSNEAYKKLKDLVSRKFE